MDIQHVAVIGGGTMGSGIAAACAAVNRDVVLLEASADLAQRAFGRVCALAKDDAERALFEERVRVGSLNGDLPLIARCDWICEAVVEDLATKRSILARVEEVRRDRSIVSTNTSGIPLRAIIEDMPARLRGDMLVTHFFNPVRVMRLLEIVACDDTRPEARDDLVRFLRTELGKGIVQANDTPNFIGNRIGLFFILSGLHLAGRYRAAGMSVETIDALLGPPIGLPATALYGLTDLIGLDVVASIARNLAATLPAGDTGHAFACLPAPEQRLVARGQFGRKSGGGYYRVRKAADGGKLKDVFRLESDSWQPAGPARLGACHAEIETLFFGDDAAGSLVRDVLGGTLIYAADLVPEIAGDIVNVDRAMRWGFAWRHGPFELIDRIGPAKLIALLRHEGRTLPRMLALLERAGASGFYANGTFLGTDGCMHPLPPE
jgi:3-hydroxyacyl-CoA dehydrogenase